MSKKIPAPVAVAVAVAAVLLLGFVVFHGTHQPGGDTADVNAIIKDVNANNPKNAPALPADVNIQAETLGVGRKGKH